MGKEASGQERYDAKKEAAERAQQEEAAREAERDAAVHKANEKQK